MTNTLLCNRTELCYIENCCFLSLACYYSLTTFTKKCNPSLFTIVININKLIEALSNRQKINTTKDFSKYI